MPKKPVPPELKREITWSQLVAGAEPEQHKQAPVLYKFSGGRRFFARRPTPAQEDQFEPPDYS